MKIRYVLLILFFIGVSSISAQDFYWENARVLINRNAGFPQTVTNDRIILTVWQEYSFENQEVVLKMIQSENGIQWSEPKEILGPFSIEMEEEVSLFTITALRNDGFSLAINTGEKEIAIFHSSSGEEFNLQEQLTSEEALLSPRIFDNGQGDPILFFTQNNIATEEEVTGGISIYYTQYIENKWTPITSLIEDENLTLNLLPSYHSFGNNEYLVFQSLYSGIRITWQLYMLKREIGSTEWEAPQLITRFTDNETQPAEYFSNQRPYLTDNGENLLLTWERNFTLQSPQIYLAELDTQGQVIEEKSSAVTTGFRYNAFPRVFQYKDNWYSLWFDNRQGNQIVFSDIRFSFRGGDSLSRISGDSSYAIPIVFKDKLFFFWENRYLEQQRYIFLAPDQSVDTPRIIPVSFQANQRSRDLIATFNWRAPVDSSGIRGYRYSWNRLETDDPSGNSQRLIYNPQPLSFQADQDGFWYFHLSAQDYAGNWSDPVHFSYYRDRTPPDAVEFDIPETDEWGYLLNNSARISWKKPSQEDTAGYNYSLSYQGANFPDPESFPVSEPLPEIRQNQQAVQLRNLDDGWWVLTVLAIDTTGNSSEPSYQFFRLNKYQPVTYISWVSSQRDDLDRIQLKITGRGFSAGGNISRIILDKDGKAPYDYEYLLDRDFNVVSDRLVVGPLIDVIDKGIYRIAVDHPQRGMAWGRNQLSLDSTGTVKYGDFSIQVQGVWNLISDPALRIILNQWSLYLLLGLFLLIVLLSALKAQQYYKETYEISTNSKAIIHNRLIYSDLLKEDAKKMKRKGLRLRAKFTLAIVTLVIFLVLIVALVLGRYMITSQQLSLGQELQKKSSILLETLVTGGKVYLPAGQRIELRQLPNQISAMEEAKYATILGKGNNDPRNYNFIWGTNDPDIDSKQALPHSLKPEVWNQWLDLLKVDEDFLQQWYSLEDGLWNLKENPDSDSSILGSLLLDAGIRNPYVIAVTPYNDKISNSLKEMEERINTKASERIGELNAQLEELSLAATKLLVRNDNQAAVELAEIQNTINMINEQINNTLQTIVNEEGINSYPSYQPENLMSLTADEQVFIFYKPIVYNENDSDQYFKGSVRLAITVEPLIKQLNLTKFTIYRITAITFAVAILAGLLGSLLLSSSMSRPIKELAQHVQIISETEDKKTLKNHIYPVRSGDEIGDLGTIINNMTHGLVEAAKANEDLMAGKEIQKAFIPLEYSRISDQKHTTGRYEDDDILIFGYYEGAKTVSGDYFDFRQLDDEYFAIIKCDIAGKGVAASLIMVEVATIFVNYFRSHRPKIEGVDLSDLVWTINDLLNEVGFKGRFAAFNIVLLNKVTGQTWMCHAGDREVNIYDSSTRKMYVKMLNDVPTAGSIDSDLLKLQNMEYKQTPHMMETGDIIFLYTDGIEEAQNLFRNSEFKQITCDGSCGATDNDPKDDENNSSNHIKGETFEEFTTVRVFDIIETCLDKGIYTMTKHHDPLGLDHEMVFDYTHGQGNADEAVLALIAAQFVYQLIPDPNANELDRVMVDKRVDEFMKKYFRQYREYFKYPMENKENGEYIYYTHLKKDDQTDDLTILAIRKK